MRKIGKVICGACVLVFFIGILLLLAYSWIAWKFQNATLDIIIIQLSMPLTGMDTRYYYSAGGVALAIVALTALYARLLWKTFAGTPIWGVRPGILRSFFCAAAVCLLGVSIFLLEKKFALNEFLFPGEPFSTYLDDNYHMPRPEEFTFPNGKNNLVVLVLESMEWTFDDRAIFGQSLIPRLASMRKEGIGFMGHRQCIGAEYSVSGFNALMLAMPSRANLSARIMVDLFFGRIKQEDLDVADMNIPRDIRDYSLMGILEQHGYRVSLFRAADARFGGYDSIMRRSTNNCDIRDFSYFLNNRADLTGKQNGWGLFDSYLYARAREYMLENYANGPFVMLVQTVGTHPPGYSESNLPRPYGDLRDTYVQADMLAADFIEWIRNQPFGANTTIVAVGDHLMGEGDMKAVDFPSADRRSIMAMILNSKVDAPSESEKRLFGSWDMTPTMLEAAGAVFPGRRFALGSSLFSPEPNLLERDGLAKYNLNIKKRSRFSEVRYGW